MKINPGAHIQLVKNGLTLRHPLLPPQPEAPPQPLPPALSLAPAQPAPFATSFRDPENAQRFFTEKRLPRISGFGEPIENAPVNGFSFVDRRYRDIFRLKKVVIKRDNEKAEASEKTLVKRDVEVIGCSLLLMKKGGD